MQRVAIVTGAARGLGLDIARRLLRNGMEVTMADVDEAVHAAGSPMQSAARGIPFKHVVAEVRDRIPLGRHGTGDDVAAMVSFLASEDTAYITGQTINVDGGYQLV